MKTATIWSLVILLLMQAVSACNRDGVLAPGGGSTPPEWVDTVGVASNVTGDSEVSVYWGEAIDYQDPPVEYLVYIDEDDFPWDTQPVVRQDTEPYMFTGLENGTTYRFGVRTRDSANPPNVDENNAVLSAIPQTKGYALTWGSTGFDYSNSVAVDTTRNIYVGGSFRGDIDFDPGPGIDIRTLIGFQDAYLVKFDSQGQLLWARTWGGHVVELESVAIDGQGNIYVTGGFSGATDFDPGPAVNYHIPEDGNTGLFLSKFDPSGNLLWVKTWYAMWMFKSTSVGVDSSGSIYLTGYFNFTVDFDPGPAVDNRTSHGAGDAFLVGLDSSGSLRWVRTWGGTYPDKPSSIAADALDGIYITGRFESKDVDFDPGPGEDLHSNTAGSVFLSKFDADGDFQWARIWHGKYGISAATDLNGNVYVAGSFESANTDFDPGPGVDYHSSVRTDAFLVKYDSKGNYLWGDSWGGNLVTSANEVTLDKGGNAFVAGSFRGNTDFDSGPGAFYIKFKGGFDAYLSKFDPDGNYLWTRSWGGQDTEGANSAAVSESGDLYVTGTFNGSIVDFDPGAGVDNHGTNGDYDSFLIKFRTDGNW